MRTVVKMLIGGVVRPLMTMFDLRPEVSVLMYHAIDDSDWELAVSPEVLQQQFEYLANSCKVVPLSEIVAYAKGEKTFQGKVTALTFDDGFNDIHTTVLPLLQRYDLQATVFLPTDISVDTTSRGTPRMSWDAIREVASSGRVSFEAHSRTHPVLCSLTEDEIRMELRGCADDIELSLGQRPRFFAYPHGERNRLAEKIAREAGYDAAFGVTEGLINRGDNLYGLKRVQVDASIRPLLFRMRLTRAIDYPKIILSAMRAGGRRFWSRSATRPGEG